MLGTRDFGIDLGSANMRVYVSGNTTFTEPAIACYSKSDDQLVQIGTKALRLLESDPERYNKYNIREKGYHNEKVMIDVFHNMIEQRQNMSFLLHPDLLMGLPHGTSPIERNALRDLCVESGFNDKGLYFIDELLAAAIGAELPVLEPQGTMIIDIGASKTQAGVLSLGGMIISDTIAVGGNILNEQIADYILHEYGMMVGQNMAEQAKMSIGSVLPTEMGSVERIKLQGRNIDTGLPDTITVTAEELLNAITPSVQEIVTGAHSMIEQLSPDLIPDLMEHGITLTGGASLMKGIDALIHKATQLPVHTCPNASDAVILGIQKVIQDPKAWNGIYSGLLR